MSPEECREVFEMLSEYIDGGLSPGACEQIERHIAACPPCVQFVESLKKSIRLCREYRPSGSPHPLSQEAKQQLADAYRRMLERSGGSNAPS